MMKNPRYPQGYLPKIAFHIFNTNPKGVEYFTNRHEDLYGPITADDMTRVIEMVMEMQEQQEPA